MSAEMKYLIFLALVCAVSAVTWNQVNPRFGLGTVQTIFGDNDSTLVMVMDSSESFFQVYYSKDNALTWQEGSIKNPNNYTLSFYSCAGHYFNNNFIIYTDSNGIFTSQDGITFTLSHLPFSIDNLPVQFTNKTGTYLATASDSTQNCLISSDGINWKITSNIGSFVLLYSIGDAIVGTGPYVYTEVLVSWDGINWTIWRVSDFGSYSAMNFYPGKTIGDVTEYIAIGFITEACDFFSSLDQGATWQKIGSISGQPSHFIYYLGFYSILLSSQNQLSLEISKDLITWLPVDAPVNSQFPPYFYAANEQYFGTQGPGYFSSLDMYHWTTLNLGVTQFWSNIYVLNGNSLVLESAYDFTAPSPHKVRYFDENLNLIASSPIGTIQSSWQADDNSYNFFSNTTVYSTSDFQEWTQMPVIYQEIFSTVINGNGVYVALRHQVQSFFLNFIYTFAAPDLTGPWILNKESAPARLHGFSTAFGNGLFVLQLDGLIYTAADGATWTVPDPTLKVSNFSTISFVQNVFYVQLPSLSQCIASVDGISWQDTDLVVGMPTVKYVPAANLYFALGAKGQVATSPDGLSWELSSTYSVPNSNANLNNIAFNGKTWIASDISAGIYVATD